MNYLVLLLASVSLAGPPMPSVIVVPKAIMHSSTQVKGATKLKDSAKSSFVSVQPVTNYCTIVYDNTHTYTDVNKVVYTNYPFFRIVSTSDLNKLPLTNIMTFPSGTTNIRQAFAFTNKNRFFGITLH